MILHFYESARVELGVVLLLGMVQLLLRSIDDMNLGVVGGFATKNR